MFIRLIPPCRHCPAARAVASSLCAVGPTVRRRQITRSSAEILPYFRVRPAARFPGETKQVICLPASYLQKQPPARAEQVTRSG